MARRKRGKIKTALILAVLGLASFGGYTLYNRYQSDVDSIAKKVQTKTKKVVKAVRD